MSTIATGQGKELKFAAISATASGDTVVVAADTNRKIKVVSYVLVAAAAVSVKFKNGSTDVTGAMPLGVNGGVAATGQPSSHLLETAANTALNINLSGATTVAGHISYFLEA